MSNPERYDVVTFDDQDAQSAMPIISVVALWRAPPRHRASGSFLHWVDAHSFFKTPTGLTLVRPVQHGVGFSVAVRRASVWDDVINCGRSSLRMI